MTKSQLIGDEIELWVNKIESGDNVDEDDGNGTEGVVTVIEGVEVDGVQLDDPGDGKCGLCVLLFFILCAFLQKSVLHFV